MLIESFSPSRSGPLVLLALVSLALCGLALADKTNLGKGITCSNVRCGFGSKCVMKSGRPVCECEDKVCIAIYQPVCGSDNITYG